MKNIMKSALVAGVVATLTTTTITTTAFAKSGGGGGKPVKNSLHFNLSDKMNNEGVEPDASGSVKAQRNVQGNSDKQSLQVTVNKLAADTTYSVFVGEDGDTNLTSVTDFTTDGNGNASLSFSSSVKTASSGKGKNPLPDAVNPVSNIRELDIVNGDSVVVLSSDFTTADTLKFQETKDISAGDVTASVKVSGTENSSSFQLKASGLQSDTDYNLVANGNNVNTATSDSKGKLVISGSQSGLSPGSIQHVALTDQSDTEIVGTDLP